MRDDDNSGFGVGRRYYSGGAGGHYSRRFLWALRVIALYKQGVREGFVPQYPTEDFFTRKRPMWHRRKRRAGEGESLDKDATASIESHHEATKKPRRRGSGEAPDGDPDA